MNVPKRLPEGQAFLKGMEEVARFLGARGGASNEKESAAVEGRLLTYLYSVFIATHGMQKVGARNFSEMKMLAEVIDRIKQGEIAQVADILMQRFKALEVSVTEGSWEVAKHLDYTHDSRVSLASVAELTKAGKETMLAHRLAEVKKKYGLDKH